jgi:uncharacterized protein YkwD
MNARDFSFTVGSGLFADPNAPRAINIMPICFILLIGVLAWAPVFEDTECWAESTQKADRAKTKKEKLLKETRDKIFEYTNKERKKKGLKPLQQSRALEYLARKHSSHMCDKGKFKHESKAFPKGWETLPGRLKKVGVHAGGENIAYRTLRGKADKWAEHVVEGWMKSKGHRKNILDPKFKYLGVGLVPCKELGYTTQVFSPASGEDGADSKR